METLGHRRFATVGVDTGLLIAGDPERAALLAGVAEGLQRRAGLRAWPMLRRGETELAAQIRETLGPDDSTRCTPPGPAQPGAHIPASDPPSAP